MTRSRVTLVLRMGLRQLKRTAILTMLSMELPRPGLYVTTTRGMDIGSPYEDSTVSRLESVGDGTC